MRRFLKDPSDLLDYTVKWGDWLGPTDTIAASDTPDPAVVWTVPTGITEDHHAKTTTDSSIWLSGGTAGQEYAIACKIRTEGGRIAETTFVVQVTQR